MTTNIWPDYKIVEWARLGGIIPYDYHLVNPASIDLCLGDGWIDMAIGTIQFGSISLHPYNPIYEFWYRMLYQPLGIQHRPYAVLATTWERLILNNNLAAMVKLKTTPCRLGLGHPIADWVDPGFRGQLTLMLSCTRPITLKVGQRIAQLVLIEMEYPNKPYGEVGHYQNQAGPTKAWIGG